MALVGILEPELHLSWSAHETGKNTCKGKGGCASGGGWTSRFTSRFSNAKLKFELP